MALTHYSAAAHSSILPPSFPSSSSPYLGWACASWVRVGVGGGGERRAGPACRHKRESSGGVIATSERTMYSKNNVNTDG